MLKITFFIMALFATLANAQENLNILFVYGSTPKSESEERWLGGKHGGHVSLQYKDGYASFVPESEVHIFPQKERASAFISENDGHFVFDTSGSRYLIISIPIDAQTDARIDSILQQRMQKPGYDYAFFGMRCASAAYEVMSTAGMYPVYSKRKMSIKYFYPKLLRKQLMKQAKTWGWKTFYRPGRKARKWENDLLKMS